MNKLFNFLASGFYISLLPAKIMKGRKNTGAGFLGTAVAVPFVFLIRGPWWAQLAFAAAFAAFAVFIVTKSTFEGHDSPKIVIDEMAGFFVAAIAIPRAWQWLLAAFVLFRLFDWLKPFFVKKFDDMHTPAGVVFDDVAAGVLANVLIQLYIFAMPSIFKYFGPQYGGPF